jgi:hypothetical protein
VDGDGVVDGDGEGEPPVHGATVDGGLVTTVGRAGTPVAVAVVVVVAAAVVASVAVAVAVVVVVVVVVGIGDAACAVPVGRGCVAVLDPVGDAADVVGPTLPVAPTPVVSVVVLSGVPAEGVVGSATEPVVEVTGPIGGDGGSSAAGRRPVGNSTNPEPAGSGALQPLRIPVDGATDPGVSAVAAQ